MSMKFQVPAAHFARALRNVAPAASTVKDSPSLNSIHLRWSPRRLEITATDRYIAIRETIPLTGRQGTLIPEESGECMVRLADVRSLIDAAKGVRDPRFHLGVAYEGESLTVSVLSSTATVRTVAGAYVDLDTPQVLGDVDSGEIGLVSIDPRHLSILDKLRGPDGRRIESGLTLRFGRLLRGRPCRLIHFSLGEHIRGAIAPSRP